jgi:prepilin signal peptidase PulO-like enzyme (type II secretory pathway)
MTYCYSTFLFHYYQVPKRNHGAKIVKFIPSFKKLYSNVSCHMLATAAKFVLPIPICLAYIVPLDVDVT